MGKSLSLDLRQRVVDAVESGLSRRAAAERFGVSVSSAVRWTQRARTLGHLAPGKRGGDKRTHRIDAYSALILGWVNETPDITLGEVSERLAAAHGYKPAWSVVCRFFQRHGMTRKKRQRMPPSRTAPM